MPAAKSKKRFIWRLAIILAVLYAIVWIALHSLAGKPETNAKIESLTPAPPNAGALPFQRTPRNSLRVLSFNIAHGRGTGVHQALCSQDEIQSQLKEIAKVLRREDPDIVGLQEADSPSIWSGSFDHIGFLAADARIPYFLP
ncbi:MAG: hypothetical protein AAF517_15625 [Planctomycetota bacterium]